MRHIFFTVLVSAVFCETLHLPKLPLGLFKRLKSLEQHQSSLVFQQDAELPKYSYPTQYFKQKVSHDPNKPPPKDRETFRQRYWFDDKYYKKGGPVILLDGGETDASERLPFLQTGILAILCKATGGLGVVLEHRYYGPPEDGSFPVPDLSTKNLQYLDTLSSLYDSAYFARNVQFKGVPYNLTASKVPWVYYGGSYAGAKSAFARKLFPDVFVGAIASSAVTTAIVDYWEYYLPIIQNADPECISALQNNTALIDSLFELEEPLLAKALKSYFGLGEITRNEDFVNALAMPLGAWQGLNWDPDVSSQGWDQFCAALIDTKSDSSSASLISLIDFALSKLGFLFPFPTDPTKHLRSLQRHADFVKANIVPLCPEGMTQDECFGTNDASYAQVGLEEADWRSWTWQVCNEWGYFIGAPPESELEAVRNRIVSKMLRPKYTSEICHVAFPPSPDGTVKIPPIPNVNPVNQLGSFDFEHSNLAFVDGSADPWLYATPHSPHASNPHRISTVKRPFYLIPGGVHHWDQNGRSDGKTPKKIEKIHHLEVMWVKNWIRRWEIKRQNSE